MDLSLDSHLSLCTNPAIVTLSDFILLLVCTMYEYDISYLQNSEYYSCHNMVSYFGFTRTHHALAGLRPSPVHRAPRFCLTA